MFGGIIAHIDNSGYHGIILSQKDSWKQKLWSTDRAKFDVDLTDKNIYTDGKYNTEYIVDFYSTKKPKVVAGVTSWIYKDNIVTAKISKPTTVLVTF